MIKKRKGRFQRRRRHSSRSLMLRQKPRCPLKTAGIKTVDYKDLSFLEQYVNDEWRILPGRVNNISALMQRQIKLAVKRARYLSLLPYTPHHSLVVKEAARGGGR